MFLCFKYSYVFYGSVDCWLVILVMFQDDCGGSGWFYSYSVMVVMQLIDSYLIQVMGMYYSMILVQIVMVSVVIYFV